MGAYNTGQSLERVFPQVTLTVTDNNGNTATCTASVTVEDNVPPDITCPNSIAVAATSPSGAIVNYTTPVGTDNCTPITVQTTGLPSGATFPIGTTTNTFDVTDQEGTNFNCAFNVIVTGLAPDIVCPANISVNTDPGQCGAIVSFAATDNTGIPASSITYSQDPGTSFPVGTTTVTATATNAVGTDQCSFTVTVTDNTPPEAICEDIMVTLDANGSVTIMPNQVDNGSNDACGIQSLSLSQSTFSCSDVDGGYAANPAIIPGTPTELTVTDANGNTATCTAMVIVVDNTAPAITCPDNMQVPATSTSGATVAYTPPVGTDNCTPTTTQTAGLPSGSTFPIGTTTNTFTVEDPSGATAGCSFDVTVTAVSPDIVCPDNITVGTDDGQCSAVVSFAATDNTVVPASMISYSHASGSAFPVGTTTVTATAASIFGRDNCTFDITVNDNEIPSITCTGNITMTATGPSGAVVTYTPPVGTDNCTPTTFQTAGFASGATFPIGTTTNTFLVSDQAGSVDICFFTVTVSGVAPDVVCPGNITVNNDPGQCGAVVTFAAMENTGIPASDITYSDLPGSFFAVGTTTVTVTATNVVGSDNCSFDIIVNDIEVPAISCPGDISLVATSSSGAVATFTPPVGTDNCLPTTTQTAGFASGATFPIGMTTNTFTVTDPSGASTSCSFTVTVTGVAPDIVCPTDITVDTDPGLCSAVVDFQATENTGIPPTVINYSHEPGSVFPIGATMVTASASNVVGSDECSFTITVEDNTDPVIACPDDIIIQTGSGLCGANVEFDVIASDNCGETTLVYTIGGVEPESNCASNTIDLSIIFDDYPGETSWMLTTIEEQVVESGGPYYGQPGGSTLDLSFNLPDGQYIFVIKDALGDGICCAYGEGSYTLSSEGNVILTGGMFGYSEKTTFCVETPSSGSEPLEVQSGDFFPVGTTTVTCTVTDGSGNIDVCTFDITVNDTEAPILDTPCPQNITLCGAQNVYWTPPAASDNCEVVLSTNNYSPGEFFDVGNYTVTYTFYDKAGLSVSCSFSITIHPAPDVVIAQENVPLWCQGVRLLTANVLNPDELNYPLAFEWSNGLPGDPSVIVPENGTYTLFVTDAMGCETEVSTVVNEDISSLFSAYTIISGEEFEMYESDVMGGGVGIEDADEAEIGLYSNIFTFLRADANNVAVDGTSFINEFIDEDLEVVLPPFQNNPNNVVTTTNIPAGTTMTLSNSIYGYVFVGTGATLIIDNSTMYMQNLKTAKGATIIFTQPTDLMIRRRLSIGETNIVNPDGHTCVIYVGDEASVNQGSVVTVNIYSPEGLEVNDSGATLTTYMTGIFISDDQVSSDHNVVWNWNLNCSFLPSGDNEDLPIAQPADNSELIGEETSKKPLQGLNVYPNPTSGVINVEVEAFVGQPVEYTIYDSFGKEVLRKVIDHLELPVISIDMSPAQFTNGLYQMSLKCEDELRTVRFVLSK
ncbi:MAG: HYR domain-containing protein [Bacteroidetes bacterium]|nr:MAG: HYR domain-containing protein [Bacteroidota bacterium]